MSYILGNYDSTQEAFKDEEFVFIFPNIILAADSSSASVEDLTGDGTEWEVTLNNFPLGMEIYQSETNKTTSGFLSVTSGQLDSIMIKWTPAAGDSYFVQDGRLIRPRFWIISVRVDGKGGWSGFQFEFGISIQTSDQKLVAQELTDDASAEKHGTWRELGLEWFHPDHLDQALARRYKDPPRVVTHQVLTVQETKEKLAEVMSIEPGDVWTVGTSTQDPGLTMPGMVMSVGYEIGQGGLGVGYKQVTFIERFSSNSVILSVEDIPLAVNGVELGLEA